MVRSNTSTGAQTRRTREALTAWGAPLFGVTPAPHDALEESLVRGLEFAAHDGTVLRVLPLVLARNLSAVDWRHLRVLARRRKLKAEVGWLIELTAALLGRPELNAEAAPLRTRGRRTFRFFPAVKGRIEAELAKVRSPELARRWGFWMNMTTDTFRSLLEKHEPGIRPAVRPSPPEVAREAKQFAALRELCRLTEHFGGYDKEFGATTKPTRAWVASRVNRDVW